MRQTACLVVNPITVESYALLFGSGLRLNDGFFIKLSQVGWGLMLCLWLGIAMVQLVGFLTPACSGFRFSQEYLSLFHHSDQFDFVSSLWCIVWVREPLCKPNFLCIFVLIHWDQGCSLSTVKNIFKLQVVYATDCCKAVVPVLFLCCVAL